MKNTKEIGIEVESPKKECNDKKCPFHGEIKVRGRTFVGKILKKDTNKTAVVEWKRLVKLSKYERFEDKRSKVSAHNPLCIDAQKGDSVLIVETRPLSKTKKFVIVQVMKKNESD